ncbi:MAG TPA: LytR C-terminal domain-containing protein [Solirubrobacterales bacterium]|nr:LytR C-terminal domain-containing protein [Solirubrobacterales bacterium]
MELIKEIGAYAGLVAFIGLAVLALLSFAQGRDIRRLREWAGSAPERDSERKESTSAAAAQRAEEMRRLEEARESERQAADLRETRRERREAGLPELTRGERLRERFGGGEARGGGLGARLGDPRYLVGVFVVLILIGGGIAYAVTQSGGEGSGNGGGKSGKRASSAALNPGEIEVTVLNGTAVDGLAGTYGNKVEQHGFQLGAVGNSKASYSESVVMFERGEGRAAHRVADTLEISRVRPISSEIASLAAGASVAVVVGEDNASASG